MLPDGCMEGRPTAGRRGVTRRLRHMTAYPFRFTVQGSKCRTIAEFTELARKAEDLGYQAVTIADHFDAQVGPLVALAAAAHVTTTLELGTLVLSNDYRHPVVAAK